MKQNLKWLALIIVVVAVVGSQTGFLEFLVGPKACPRCHRHTVIPISYNFGSGPASRDQSVIEMEGVRYKRENFGPGPPGQQPNLFCETCNYKWHGKISKFLSPEIAAKVGPDDTSGK